MSTLDHMNGLYHHKGPCEVVGGSGQRRSDAIAEGQHAKELRCLQRLEEMVGWHH